MRRICHSEPCPEVSRRVDSGSTPLILNKRFLLSCLIFLIVFGLIGLPFTNWWFNGDDFSGLALGHHMQGLKGFIWSFTNGDVNYFTFPTHHPLYTSPGIPITHNLSFFEVFYRPIQCITTIIQYKFFGLSGYAYYLANTFFHAFNSVLFFNMALFFTGYLPALLTALLFAFHPQIGFKFGGTVNLQYHLNIFLLFLVIFLLKYFLDTKKIWSYLLSCLLFTLAVFTRETGLVFPVLLPLGIYLYQKRDTAYSFFNFLYSIPSLLLVSSGYIISNLIYLYMRAHIYPFPTSHSAFSPSSFLMVLKSRQYEFVTFIYDALCLSWLPWGHKVLRGSLVLFALLGMIWLFAHNKQKLLLGFLGLSLIFFAWPSIILCYVGRYFPEIEPFIFLIFIILFAAYKKPINPIIKKIGLTLLALFVVFNITLTFKNLKIREEKLATIGHAITDLTQNQDIKNRALCFLVFPIDGLAACLSQAIWVFTKDFSTPVIYEDITRTVQTDHNVLENKGWYSGSSSYLTKNFVTITPTTNGFRITSQDPSKICFQDLGNKKTSPSNLGTITVYQTQKTKDGTVLTDFEITLSEKYRTLNPLIFTFDYEKRTFIKL